MKPKKRISVALLQTIKEGEKLEENSRNNTTHHKAKTSLFKGRTKHILLALPAILILACILAIPLASNQFKVYALPQANGANPSGGISAMGGTTQTTNNDGLSFLGNMTVNGNTTLTGNLSITNSQQVVLGSPLIANGLLNLTGSEIEEGKPTSTGGNITILGNSTSPAWNVVEGNFIVGNTTTGTDEAYFNVTNFYQYVNSTGGGFLGDYNNQSNVMTLPNNDVIRVTSGQVTIYSYQPNNVVILGGLVTCESITIVINHNWANFTMVTDLMTINTNVNLWGLSGYSNANYSGQVNVTEFAQNSEFPIISFLGIITLVNVNSVILSMVQTPAEYLTFTAGTVFDSWGPYIAVGSSSAGGVMLLYDSYIYMNSSSSIAYNFLTNDPAAAITVQNSTNYSTAELDVSTTNLSITGFTNGNSTIVTGGGILVNGYSNVSNLTQITQGTFSYTGNMLVNGNQTIQGNITMTGYNDLQAPVTVSGQMNVNSGNMSGTMTLSLPSGGSMATTGTLNITNGLMNITKGTMNMNSTGIFVYGASNTSIGGSVTLIGTMSITGSPTITGNIGLSGYNNLQGSITIQGNMNINNGQTTGDLTITINPNSNGTSIMETMGTMNITNGTISLPSTINMVINSTGTYITGSTITINGTQITSQGTTTITGDTTINSSSLTMGNSLIKGQITIPNTYLNINGGSMSGTGTITVSNGYMQTIGSMTLTNGVITESGTITMSPSGTTIDSITTITSSRIDASGTVTNAGTVTMSGNFQLLMPMSMTGAIVTSGTAVMGSLGTVNGVMTIFGSAIMTGPTQISGVTNIMGSMSVTASEALINGGVSLTGSIITGSTPTLGSSTVITINSGSLNGLSVPSIAMPGNTIVSILTNPLILVSIGILGVGTVYVVARSIYIGIKERQTLGQRIRRLSEAFRKLSEGFRRQS
jgi:hypothetical protein